mgnify:CR=1 FL=1
MPYTISERNAIQVVEVNSLLSEFDNKRILQDIQDRIEKGSNQFIVDLSHLSFMNSVGLNFLIMMRSKSENSGGNLAIANAPDQVINLLELTKLKPHFNLIGSVNEAIEVFK